MEMTLEQTLQKGIEAHKAGQFQEADRLYASILEAQPKHPDANHNMGVIAIGFGKTQEALLFFKKALESNPTTAQFWLSYIDVLIKLKHLEEAKAVLDQAKVSGADDDILYQLEQKLTGSMLKIQNPQQEQLQTLISFYKQGKFKKSLSEALRLQHKFPDSFILYNICGASFTSMDKPKEAIDAYKKGIAINPDYVEAYNNMGNTLKNQDKLEEAIKAFKKAIAINPNYAEAYNNMGNTLKNQDKLEEAIEAFKKSIKIKPKNAEAHNNMGNTLQDQDNLEEAIEAYRKAIAINPNYTEAYNNMGNTLKNQDMLQEAMASYKKAIAMKPNYAEAYNNMGSAFRDQDKRADAIKAFKKAISIKHNYAAVHRNLSMLVKYNVNDPQITLVQNLMKRLDLRSEEKCHLHYAFAKMMEDLGNLDTAFENYDLGSTLRKNLLAYTINQDQKLFFNLKKSQPSIVKRSLKKLSILDGIVPVFILGMPRSGTTLVEQIISSHSKVTGAGELNFVSQFGAGIALGLSAPKQENILNFRKKYLEQLANRANGRSLVADKMPLNFRFIALICAALPEAKIIHVQRNAAATCWSNYKHYFPSKGLGYSNDLEDILAYYQLYKNLMQFWKLSYSNRIYKLNYEKLTTNQDNETKKLIQHLNLGWEVACLNPQDNRRNIRTASSQQVKQKVYKGSSQEWRKFKPFLKNCFDVFDD